MKTSTFKTLESNNVIEPFSNMYQGRWESRASVRSRPRKLIDFFQPGYFFPEEKQPLLLNQDVIALGVDVKSEILLQSFIKYLCEIINLEIKLIVSASTSIAENTEIVKYSDSERLNAYSVIIDEYYHVYVANDMLLQIRHQFPNLPVMKYPLSDAHSAVVWAKTKLDEKLHGIFDIIAVAIFETTLVRELVEFFNSKDVHPSIKFYVNDHMNDEARHYGYFFDILTFTWEQIDGQHKDEIGRIIPEFIKRYLNIESDRSFHQDLLTYLFSDEKKAADIVGQLYKGFDVTPDVPIVKNVLNVLRKSNILQSHVVLGGFKNLGWELMHE